MVDTSRRFTQLVRVGYFARAVLYGVLGLLALTGIGKIGEGANGVFDWLEALPGGPVILGILVVGLAAYGLFRLASLAFDIEHSGSDRKGWLRRAGHGASGVAHLLLAWTAAQFANTGSSGGTGGGAGAHKAASGVLEWSLGPVLLSMVGVAFLVGALQQAKKGYTGEFMRSIDRRAPEATRWIGAAGYGARAVVYLVIGWSVLEAAWLSRSTEIETLGSAISSLADKGFGFTLMAIGLLAFGAFSLILARYRIIPDLDLHGRMPRLRT